MWVILPPKMSLQLCLNRAKNDGLMLWRGKWQWMTIFPTADHRWWRSACCNSSLSSRGFIYGGTPWTSPVIWPISLICALKYNIQKSRWSNWSFLSPIRLFLYFIGPLENCFSLFPFFDLSYPDMLRLSVDVGPSLTQELQKRRLLNTLYLFHKATVPYLPAAEAKKRKRNRKWNGTPHLVSGTSGSVLLLNNQHPFRGVLCALCVGNKIIIFKCCSSLITDLNAASRLDHRTSGEFPLNLLPTVHSSLPPFPLNHPRYKSAACFMDVIQTCTCQRWREVMPIGAGWHYLRGDVLLFWGWSSLLLFLRNFLTSAFNCHRSRIWECL